MIPFTSIYFRHLRIIFYNSVTIWHLIRLMSERGRQ